MFWSGPEWRTQNFGDDLSPIIVEAVSKRSVEWAPPRKAELLAIGSILNRAVHANNKMAAQHEQMRPVHIWGSGYIEKFHENYADHIFIHALRGSLSLFDAGTKAQNVALGDPAILAPMLFDKPVNTTHEYGFVTHYSQVNHPLTQKFLDQFPEVKLINPAQDVEIVINEIRSCDFIFSSSLHGLILADSYSIPNIWVQSVDIHNGHGYKFYDYFSSVGRPAKPPLDLLHIENLSAHSTDANITYFNNLEGLRENLLKHFPHDALKENTRLN